MTSIIIGSFLISLLHAVIPNHWLPVLAIGRKEGWDLKETTDQNAVMSDVIHRMHIILLTYLDDDKFLLW